MTGAGIFICIKDSVFIDPACGSGNFLTETFLSLRRLENEVLRQRIAADRNEVAGQIMLDFGGTYSIKVSIGQFYGIEINDFAVTVAKTALWISEEQMIRETQEIIHTNIDFLPLKAYANIVQGNALQIDWESVVWLQLYGNLYIKTLVFTSFLLGEHLYGTVSHFLRQLFIV